MVEKQAKSPTPKKIAPAGKRDQGKPGDRAAGSSPEPIAVDRPGFDLGGSTGKTSAGTGLGLGVDAAENRRDRRLPRGGVKSKQSGHAPAGSLGTILIIVLIIFLLGGFSGRFGGYGYGFGHGGVGVIGTILIIVLVLMVLGRI